MPKTAIIALGSNLGDSRALMDAAMARLQQISKSPLRVSTYWETAPVDCPPGSPKFLNAVALMEPLEGESPETLLCKLQSMEKELGRRPKIVMNEARSIDLDIITFGDEQRDTAELTLPHPRACQRRFVLGPLCELAPDFKFPGQSTTAAQLLAALP